MQNKKSSHLEFIALMASLMSVVALAIDALLPALDVIGIAIGTTKLADNQLLITMIFLGFGIGPMFFGPASDSFGRKPLIYIGFSIFIVASIICVFSQNMTVMIIGRILQGIGLSSPRILSIAIIRDKFSGDYMARMISFVTAVFLLVPIIAPALGKWVLDTYNWQGIFYVQILVSLLVTIWFWRRQPETLIPSHKKAFTLKVFNTGFREIFSNKITMGYTIVLGLITGSFLVFLSSAQQIFQEQYGLKEAFPSIFAGLAIGIAVAILSNASLVMRFGMHKIVGLAVMGFFVSSLVYVLLFHNTPNPTVWVAVGFFALQFFAVGFLFGNLRALAMEPVGHIAGIGAAITGLISTLMAVPISTYIGSFVTTTALPLFLGFLVCSGLSLVFVYYLGRFTTK